MIDNFNSQKSNRSWNVQSIAVCMVNIIPKLGEQVSIKFNNKFVLIKAPLWVLSLAAYNLDIAII